MRDRIEEAVGEIMDVNPLRITVHYIREIARGQVSAILRKHLPDIPRVLEWFRRPNRMPAHLAFTAGPDRELADELEAIEKSRGSQDAPASHRETTDSSPPDIDYNSDPAAWMMADANRQLSGSPAGFDLPDGPGVWFRDEKCLWITTVGYGYEISDGHTFDSAVRPRAVPRDKLPRGGWSRAVPESEVQELRQEVENLRQQNAAMRLESKYITCIDDGLPQVVDFCAIENELDSLRKEVERMKRELREAQKAETGWRDECQSVRAERDELRHWKQTESLVATGQYWGWPVMASDHPESLVCPIIVQPDKMREIQSKLTAAQARIAELESSRYPRLVESGPLPEGFVFGFNADRSADFIGKRGLSCHSADKYRKNGWRFWDYGPLADESPAKCVPLAMNPCVSIRSSPAKAGEVAASEKGG